MLERQETILMTDIKLNPRPHLCFLYDFNRLGVTPKEVASSMEGWHMTIFRWIMKKGMGGTTSQRKCPWCGENFPGNLWQHIVSEHHRNLAHLEVVKMQNALYSQLMKTIKSHRENYFSHAVLFGSTCKYCVRPRIKGREGMCALPESARNKQRSLSFLGFSCKGLSNESWLHDRWLCAILHKEVY